MANAIKWSALGSTLTVINGDGSVPTLKNLSNLGKKLGNEVDNATDRNQYADFELQVRGSSAFTTGGYAELYLIQALDGTNYADGNDSISPPASALVGVFPFLADTTQQRIVVRHVFLPATKFKPLIVNKGGPAFTNTDNENLLRMRTYNHEIN